MVKILAAILVASGLAWLASLISDASELLSSATAD
jgi:hypothetical protein